MTQLRPSARHAPAVVVVVDDDASVRNALSNLLQSSGLSAHAFASAAEFEAWPMPDAPACLVLDVRMPGLGGLELQQELRASRRDIPIVFITAHGDIPMSVRAIKAGAVEFLTKPFRDQDLLDAIHTGLAESRALRDARAAGAELAARYDSLSRREREIMGLVLGGQLTKQIAATLHLSEITVKVCRAQLMRKMQAGSLLDLGRMAEKLERMKGAAG